MNDRDAGTVELTWPTSIRTSRNWRRSKESSRRSKACWTGPDPANPCQMHPTARCHAHFTRHLVWANGETDRQQSSVSADGLRLLDDPHLYESRERTRQISRTAREHRSGAVRSLPGNSGLPSGGTVTGARPRALRRFGTTSVRSQGTQRTPPATNYRAPGGLDRSSQQGSSA